MIVKMATGEIETHYGVWRETLYYDGIKEIIAFHQGELDGKSDVLCRVHSSCIYGHYFNSAMCDCKEQMELSQKMIQEIGEGIIILLDQEGKGNGHFALLRSIEHKRKGLDQAEAYEKAGFSKDSRDFSPAAKVLAAMNIRSVKLITSNSNKVETMESFGIKVSGMQASS